MAQIFISYAHDDDSGFVQEMDIKLQAAGFGVWVDKRLLAGDDWRKEIEYALDTSFAVILVMTPLAMKSIYVAYEWAYGLGTGAKLIPLNRTNIKEKHMHPRLRPIQYLDFSDDSSLPWDALIDRLKIALAEHREAGLALPPHVENARQKLDDFDEEVRLTALKSLMNNSDPTAQQSILGVMEYPVADVARRATAIAINSSYVDGLDSLSEDHIFQTIQKLFDTLADPDAEMKKIACGAILNFIEAGHKEETFAKILERLMPSNPVEFTYLLQILHDVYGNLDEEKNREFYKAGKVPVWTGNTPRDYFDKLIKEFSDLHDAKSIRKFLQAAGQFQDHNASLVIVDYVGHKDPNVSAFAIELIVNSNNQISWNALKSAYKHSYWSVSLKTRVKSAFMDSTIPAAKKFGKFIDTE